MLPCYKFYGLFIQPESGSVRKANIVERVVNAPMINRIIDEHTKNLWEDGGMEFVIILDEKRGEFKLATKYIDQEGTPRRTKIVSKNNYVGSRRHQ